MTDQFRFRFRFGALCPVWLWLSSFFFFLIWSSFPVPTSALNDTDKDNDKNKEKEIKIEPLVGYFIISGIVSLIAGVLLASISYYGFVLHTPGPKLIRVWCVVFAVFDIVRKKPEVTRNFAKKLQLKLTNLIKLVGEQLAGGVAFGIMLGLDFRGEPWRYGLAHPVLLVGLAFELGSGVWRLVLAWNVLSNICN